MELGAFRRVCRVGVAVLLGGVLGLPAALIGTFPAYAANVVVSSGADSGPGTLRAVVAAASPGDIITFTVPTVTLTTAPITVNKNLIIRGNGAGATQITRSGAAFRIFDVTAGVTVTIDLLTITGGAGNGGGGVRNSGTQPHPQRAAFQQHNR
jgi:hypothetical protein